MLIFISNLLESSAPSCTHTGQMGMWVHRWGWIRAWGNTSQTLRMVEVGSTSGSLYPKLHSSRDTQVRVHRIISRWVFEYLQGRRSSSLLWAAGTSDLSLLYPLASRKALRGASRNSYLLTKAASLTLVADSSWAFLPSLFRVERPQQCVPGCWDKRPPPLPVLMMFPALFQEATGMQNLQRKWVDWHPCPAAEVLPWAQCKNNCWHHRGWARRRIWRMVEGGWVLLAGSFITFILSICKVCYVQSSDPESICLSCSFSTGHHYSFPLVVNFQEFLKITSEQHL